MESAARAMGPCTMSTDTLSDASLLEQHRAGNVDAFDTLFERHYVRVYGILCRFVGDEADDVCQDVFLKLYQHPPRIPTKSVAPWLYRVATNLAYNSLRGRRRWEGHRDALGRTTDGRGWRLGDVDPEHNVERSQEMEAVRATLARLTRRQAALLALRYSGLSYREIAQVLRVSAGSVGTLLSRAERAFARAYEEIDRVGQEGGS